MSIFARSQGNLGYHEALDMTAVHYARLNSIFDSWKGERAVVRFDPRVFTADLRQAAEVCRLGWSDDAFTQVYDATCKHQEPAAVSHRAESLFRQFSRLWTNERDVANLQHLERDAATRENALRSRLVQMHAELCGLTQTAERYHQENVQHAQAKKEDSKTIAQLENRLAKITSSRTWRLREWLVSAVQRVPGLQNSAPRGAAAASQQAACPAVVSRMLKL